MQIGDRIPEILGIDQDENEIKSSDYRGRKIVLRRVRCVSCRKKQDWRVHTSVSSIPSLRHSVTLVSV